MEKNENADIKIKTDWIIRTLCLYNLVAFLLSSRLVITGLAVNFAKGTLVPWVSVFIYSGIVVILAFSTIGLWFKKRWAYLVQLLLYVLQLFVIHKGALKLALYLGFQYIVTFTSTKATVSIGINLVAFIFITLLLLVRKEFLLQKQKRL